MTGSSPWRISIGIPATRAGSSRASASLAPGSRPIMRENCWKNKNITMKVLSIILLLTAALFSIHCVTAQDSLSARDATEIRHKGENLIKDDLKGLLNAISSTSFESQETADNIHNSYSEGRNQIFRDSL